MSSDSILIIEDEKDLRDVYSLILKHKGYEVHTSANGKEGLADYKAHSPKLILLDIFMPVMDGKSFLESLKNEKNAAVSVVVYSNTADKKLMQEMLQLGADKVVTKSDIDPDGLAALVEQYV